MSARHKLNQGYIQGCLLVAAAVGFLSGSWTVFGVAAVILIVLSCHAGEIRPGDRSNRRQQHRSRRP